MKAEKVAVVTGANRGIGYGTVRRLCKVLEKKGTVILTARREWKGEKALVRLKRVGFLPSYHQLDIVDPSSRRRFVEYLNKTHGGLDILVNNAGVMYDRVSRVGFAEQARETVATNLYGTMFLCNALFGLLRPHARVVNLSSSCGFLSDIPSERLRRNFGREDLEQEELVEIMAGFAASASNGTHAEDGWGTDAYCVSQVAINALTFMQQREFLKSRPDDDLVVNSYHPGAVATGNTNYKGGLQPSQAAFKIVKLAMLPANVTDPVGQYVWHNLKTVDWKGPKPDKWSPP